MERVTDHPAGTEDHGNPRVAVERHALQSAAPRASSLACNEQGLPMSVLVTGGAGYIGSHTVRRLQADGVDVVVLDSLEFGYPQSIPGVPLVVADITDRDAVARHLRRPRGHPGGALRRLQERG